MKKKKEQEELLLQEIARQEAEQQRLMQQHQEEELARKQQLEEAKRKKELDLRDKMRRKEFLKKHYDEYNQVLEGVQKKLKRLHKKLREIGDLEDRLSSSNASPTKEQLLKIEKKQETIDDIAELEEQEEKLLERKINGEFNEILNWIDDFVSDPQNDSSHAPHLQNEPPHHHLPDNVTHLEQKRSDEDLDTQKEEKNIRSDAIIAPKPLAIDEISWTTISNKGKKKQGRQVR